MNGSLTVIGKLEKFGVIEAGDVTGRKKGYGRGRTPFGTTGNRGNNRWRDGITVSSVQKM